VPDKEHNLLPRDMDSSRDPDIFLEPKIPDRTAEYVHRITDLEGRVKMLKRKVIIYMEQAEKSSVLSRTVSLLEGQLSSLWSKITSVEDGDFYMTEILEAASDQLNCKSLGTHKFLSI
jgi:hypothetical protein